MEEIKFENDRGLELAGSYWEADSDAGIVMSHGYTGDKTEWGYFDRVAEELNEAGYNVLAFDFAGSGESDDEPLSIDNQVEDLSVAIEYLESCGVDRVGLFGHSQGGLISLRNYNESIEAMVLTSPVTDSMPKYGEKRLNERQSRELEENGFWTVYREKGPRNEIVVGQEIIEEKKSVNQDKLLSGIKCPTLIIHGDQDDVVPLESSIEADRKLENSELEVIEKLDHSYDTHLDQVVDATIGWFKDYLPP